MKIEKLFIYGFGKHENVTIDLGDQMNVLYGENEAGKTTIQQFILHILFGFPQRKGTQLRYEPKSGGKYGGQIQVLDDLYGKCRIERVRGKSAGDVTVYFEDGRQGGEEALQKLLRQYDRASFESIFAFSLLQLQGFEKMDEKELSRTLLASGTTGVDALLKLEVKMEKEMDELFKKSGRVPQMNVKIKELQTLEKELQEEQKKITAYTPTVTRIHEIDEQLATHDESQKQEEKQLSQLKEQRQYLPLFKEQAELEKQIEDYGQAGFPADGIRRFESIQGKIDEAVAKKQHIEMEIAEVDKAYHGEVSSDRLTKMDDLLARESEWRSWKSEYSIAKDQAKGLLEEQERLLKRLGIEDEVGLTALYLAEVSLQKEEEMHRLLAELDRVNHEIGFVENQFMVLKKDLEQAEENRRLTKEPSKEEQEKVEKWPEIRQRLAEAKAYMAYGGQEKRSSEQLPLFAIGLALILLVFGISQQQWFVMIVGTLIGGIGVLLYLKKTPMNAQKLKEMEEFVATYAGQEKEMEQLLADLAEQALIIERLDREILQLSERVVEEEVKLQRLYEGNRQIESQVDDFMAQYGFDRLPSPGIIPELFRMVREVQKNKQDQQQVFEQQQLLKQKMNLRIEEIEAVLEQVISEEAIYELLRRASRELSERLDKHKRIKVRKVELTSALKEVDTLILSLGEKRDGLFEEAQVKSEEAYYEAFDSQQQREKVQGQLRSLEQQLATARSKADFKAWTDDELVKEITEIEAALLNLKERVNVLIEEKAMLVNEAKHLLTDETYGEKRQLFEMKKAELNALAKKWASRQAVSEAIKKMMATLQESQLPNVLAHAERIFNQLTAGKYEQLILTEQGYFEAVHKRGIHFPIIELSQATKEQAYISLRLALATSVRETAPFPIIIDDPFVHFDESRLSSMIEVLNESKKHQFIYFTCDARMKDKWKDAIIMNVSTIGSEQEANKR